MARLRSAIGAERLADEAAAIREDWQRGSAEADQIDGPSA